LLSSAHLIASSSDSVTFRSSLAQRTSLEVCSPRFHLPIHPLDVCGHLTVLFVKERQCGRLIVVLCFADQVHLGKPCRFEVTYPSYQEYTARDRTSGFPPSSVLVFGMGGVLQRLCRGGLCLRPYQQRSPNNDQDGGLSSVHLAIPKSSYTLFSHFSSTSSTAHLPLHAHGF
jgi:hypothetical protein